MKQRVNEINEVTTLLAQHGVKVTPQRTVVYIILRELGHACAEQIIEKVRLSAPTITIATIYNVLDCFVSNNIISMVNTSGNRMYFDICTHDHHHIMSSDNRQIADFNDTQLTDIIKEHLKNHPIQGFNLERINLQLIGSFEQ